MDFAVTVAKQVEPLYASIVTRETASQLADAASSVGSNYRAACVARSHAEFRAKLGVALEEADEAVYWLEYLQRTGRAKEPGWLALLKEARELAKILGASARTSRRRDDPGNGPNRPRRRPPGR